MLSDPGLQDCPIVYASPSFLAMSGYSCGEVLGRNCRFLQVRHSCACCTLLLSARAWTC